MSYVQAVVSVFSNYINFSGRAPRSEYWYYTLFGFLAIAAVMAIDKGILEFQNFGPAYILYGLLTFLPSVAVSVRRMHDTGRSGWYLLLSLTIIGGFWILYWFCKKGDEGDNAYGPPMVA